jgi:hypothetical protein
MNLRSKKTEPMAPEQIRARIADLKAQALQLDKQQFVLAEQSINDPAAEQAYNANVAEGTAVAAEIDRLEKALAGMAVAAEQQRSAEQAVTAASARKRVAGMLDDRLMAAREFEEAITAAVAAMRRLAAMGEEIGLAWPGANAPDSMAAVLAQAAVLRLCGAEMYRQAGQPIATGGVLPDRSKLPLPAPRAAGFEYMDRPEATPPLTAAIAEANSFAKSALEGILQ